MHAQNHKTALLLGATGLVGQYLLTLLLDDPRYDRVICLVRTLPNPNYNTLQGAAKLQFVQVDYEKLSEHAALFAADHVYVCLGTTIKKAGSEAAFRRVDYDYVLQAAQLTEQQHAGSFVWVSSVGANVASSNFYLRVKGELEDAVCQLKGLNSAHVNPSLLLGERNEFRIGERIAIALSRLFAPLMIGGIKAYRPVHAQEVARQMMTLQSWS